MALGERCCMTDSAGVLILLWCFLTLLSTPNNSCQILCTVPASIFFLG